MVGLWLYQTQDIVIGAYYLPSVRRKTPLVLDAIFISPEEALMAYNAGELSLQAPIKIRLEGKLVETTLGRVIFYHDLPGGLQYHLNQVVDKKRLVSW